MGIEWRCKVKNDNLSEDSRSCTTVLDIILQIIPKSVVRAEHET